jgi:polyisoprenoid-binding protein YceI
MKKIKLIVPIIAVVTLSAFTIVFSIDWKISNGYYIKFTSDGNSGTFTSLKGTVVFDPNDLNGSKFDMVVDAESISTGNGMKNRHAKSEDWFDVVKYPNITYLSSEILKTTTGYEAKGILNMHGIKKPVTIPFTFVNNKFIGSFEVNRLDYNVGSSKGMAGSVDNKILVELSVPVTK